MNAEQSFAPQPDNSQELLQRRPLPIDYHRKVEVEGEIEEQFEELKEARTKGDAEKYANLLQQLQSVDPEIERDLAEDPTTIQTGIDARRALEEEREKAFTDALKPVLYDLAKVFGPTFMLGEAVDMAFNDGERPDPRDSLGAPFGAISDIMAYVITFFAMFPGGGHKGDLPSIFTSYATYYLGVQGLNGAVRAFNIFRKLRNQSKDHDTTTKFAL